MEDKTRTENVVEGRVTPAVCQDLSTVKGVLCIRVAVLNAAAGHAGWLKTTRSVVPGAMTKSPVSTGNPREVSRGMTTGLCLNGREGGGSV